ncbi:MAG: AhpC/TSA family protein [Prevotellaceae bacterium]|jgi:peroxiredoxin|nr:AhpC/TSA family protein [Prevotellaceae bacterium]
MKRILYLMTAALLLASCSQSKPGYVITGTVEGGENGESVYLQKVENQQYVSIDTATIENGSFQFKGTQDSAVIYYVSYKPNTHDGLIMPFFLENGNISLQLTSNDDVATGTPNNDLYQEVRTPMNEVRKQMIALQESMQESTITEEVHKEKMKKMSDLSDKQFEIVKSGITKNITNPVGLYLLKQNFFSFDTADRDAFVSQIPATYDSDPGVIQMKAIVEKLKKTAVGQKFTDFELLTPDGKPIKLSDYAGKNKLTMVDFWASWCGPCRREMPNIVAAYKKYKKKGLEIVGVSLDYDGAAWKKGIKDLSITWPQMSDLKYWQCEGAQLYGVDAIPHTVLIDADGVILAKGLYGDALIEKITELLK